ncbi:MAG: ADOP family duplicated permease [Vicinamibacteraceae bacterium]
MIRRIQEAFSRLVAVFRGNTLDQDFDDELSTHIELLTDRHVRRGLSRDEARRQAMLQLGGLSATKELHRDVRGLPRVETIARATWQAWRSWRRAKAVALLAAGALAVGIGSATAIYTVVNAVMLRPLPYRDGDRFVALFRGSLNDPEQYSDHTWEDLEAYQQRTHAFDAFGWFRSAGNNLTFAGEPHYVPSVKVTLSLAHHLGVDPVLGQWFHDESGAVISSALWRRLGADPGIIGQAVALDGRSYTVTGVMPESFYFPVADITFAGYRADVWIPLDRQDGATYVAYGRRKPGVTFAEAEADVKRVAAQIAAEDPERRSADTARLLDLRETAVRDIRPTLLLLFAAGVLLFLIACASAAGLLLARSVAQARETAMRVALGARRGQLAVHCFAEGLLVSLAGAAGGVVLALTLTRAIVSMAANYLPRADEITVDWAVLLFALGTAFFASLLSSVAPLRQAARTAPADVLGAGARASAGRRSRRAAHALVVAEIALAFALLVASSILIVHLRNLSRTSVGFDADHLLTFVLSLTPDLAADPAARIPRQQRLVQAIETVPGVDHVAFANQLPFKGCCWQRAVYPDGGLVDRRASQRTSLMVVSPQYGPALGIPLLGGRFLTDGDAVQNPASIAVVINESAARRYWGAQNPIGTYGAFDDSADSRFRSADSRFRVVGVVGDVKNVGLGNPTVPEIYIPAVYARIETMYFVVRSARPAASLVPDIRRMVQGVDAEQPIHDVATMHDVIQQTIVLERVASFLTAFFTGAALLMAMLGVYGAVAYSVRQRTAEIGVRMAMGATSGGVFSVIVASGLKMVAYGVTAGGITAVIATSYLGRVFEIGDIGPAPYLYSATIVVVVALTASFLPARRAALLSPLVAIRNEP